MRLYVHRKDTRLHCSLIEAQKESVIRLRPWSRSVFDCGCPLLLFATGVMKSRQSFYRRPSQAHRQSARGLAQSKTWRTSRRPLRFSAHVLNNVGEASSITFLALARWSFGGSDAPYLEVRGEESLSSPAGFMRRASVLNNYVSNSKG